MKTPLVHAIVAAVLHQAALAQVPAVHETPVVLRAADLIPADWLQGGSHRVRDQVVTDGFMAHFTIDTDFGPFEAIGVPEVRQRIIETNAIRKLTDTSKSDLFAEGMKRSIEQPVEAVKNIVKHPVDSVKQAPKTVGHFFSKIGASIERGANKIKQQEESGEAFPTEQAAAGINETMKRAAGFDKARLDTARQLGVDPYSDNTRLQDEIDTVTWAFFAGGLPLRVGAAVASAGIAVAATNMVGVPEDTYAHTQAELAMLDATSLTSMGVKESDIKTFQIQKNLSTTRRHRIVKSLESLSHAKGRGGIIQLANSCETTRQADFLVSALAMLADRQRAGTSDYQELRVIGRLPGALSATGSLDVPAPVDYVTWTEQVAGFARRDDLGNSSKTLIHTGKFSAATEAGFAAAGWKLESTPYPGN